jgi:hypothetical protein
VCKGQIEEMIYDSSDEVYICSCGARVRYSGILKVVTAVQDSKEHFCAPTNNTPKKIQDIGLESMRREKEAQQEFYGKFHSAAQFGRPKEESPK